MYAEIGFVIMLMDGWYVMKEPDGECYDWDTINEAIDYCKQKDWKLRWFGSDQYKPKDFDQMVEQAGIK